MIIIGPRLPVALILLSTIVSCNQAGKKESYYEVKDFASVKKYDTHIHLEVEKSALVPQAIKDNFHFLNINGDWGPMTVADQQKVALNIEKAYPDQVSFAASFTVQNWKDPNWVSETIAYLKNSFEHGAIGVKVWKNIGMELKDENGKFVMIDNPRFDSVLDFIEKNDITLLSHQGEPKNCWLPVDKMTVNGDKHYFTENPQYHMFLHPEYPSYDDQINARDHMIDKHPNLRIVSVHLASLEWNVDEIAKRLDKYPKLAVDIAARIEHLENTAQTDWQKIHDFFIKYQDRILYGTDLVEQETNTQKIAAEAHEKWMNDWKFFVSDENLTNSDNMNYKGLHLPKEVVDKIYTNAEKWIPGIDKSYTVPFPAEVTKFKPVPNNPVFTHGDDNSWDKHIRERGFILSENGMYKLWYTGYNNDSTTHMRQLGYATSKDGIHWERNAGNPIFKERWTEDIYVFKLDNKYHMYAEGKDDIAHYLTSSDGIHWKDQGDLVVLKTNGDTIPGPYGTPAPFVENGKWYLFYERNDDAIWLAQSTDRKTWKNVTDEPVLKPGPQKFDLGAVAADQIIKFKDRYYMYYHANPDPGWASKGDTPWSSNVATSDDLIHWIKYGENPIVEGDHSSPIVVPDGNGFRLYTMHPDVFLYTNE